LLCPICLFYKSSVFCHGNGSLNPTLQRNILQKYRSTYMQIESNHLFNTIVNRVSLFYSFFCFKHGQSRQRHWRFESDRNHVDYL
jgi:hypothetical protein